MPRRTSFIVFFDTTRQKAWLKTTDTAKEIGLDPKIVEAAIEQEQREIEKTRTLKALLKRRKMKFYRNLASYIIVIGGLLLINTLTAGPWWFQWPALGWGIGLVFHLKAAFFLRQYEI